MTSLACGRDLPATAPLTITSTSTIRRTELPISGFQAVITERGPRETLEVLDAEGKLLGIVSDSLLDPAVLRGGWRGVRNGQPWALAVGRCVDRPVTVSFSTGRAWTRRQVSVESSSCGEFWVAEVAAQASRATVIIADAPAGSSPLQSVS